MTFVRSITVAAALAGLVAATAATTTATGQARELVYGSQLGPRHGFIRYAIPPFFDAVKKATNGDIQWKHVGGGAIVNFKSAVAGVKNGLVDAGFGIAVYVPAVLPSTALIHTMFFPGNDAVGMTGAALETVLLHCPSCQKEFRANNSLFLAGYDTTAYEYICRENVKTVADLKGLKIRSSGGGVTLCQDGRRHPGGDEPGRGHHGPAARHARLRARLGVVAALLRLPGRGEVGARLPDGRQRPDPQLPGQPRHLEELLQGREAGACRRRPDPGRRWSR